MLCRPGDVVWFEVLYTLTATTLGATGLTVTISVSEGVTNRVSAASATAMTALDATNLPGVYYYAHTVTAGFYGSITAEATTTATTVTQKALAMLFISVPFAAITSTSGYPNVNVEKIKNTTSAGVAGYMGVDWSNVNAPTSTVGLSDTTIKSVSGSVGTVSDPTSIWNFANRTLTSLGTLASDIVAQIRSAVVMVLSNVGSDESISITQGDTYSLTSEQTIGFESAAWPDLTGATVVLLAQGSSFAATLVTVGGGTTVQQIRVDLTATQTAALTASVGRYAIKATLADTVTVDTLVKGVFTVKDRLHK